MSYAIWNGYTCQTATVPKCSNSNTGYTIWNRYTCKTCTTIKYSMIDIRHRNSRYLPRNYHIRIRTLISSNNRILLTSVTVNSNLILKIPICLSLSLSPCLHRNTHQHRHHKQQHILHAINTLFHNFAPLIFSIYPFKITKVYIIHLPFCLQRVSRTI